MRRSELRETTVLVLLGLMSLVGGLGHGLHALVGCWHGPVCVVISFTPGQEIQRDALDLDIPRESRLRMVSAASEQRLQGLGCPLCTLLASFRATSPTAVTPPGGRSLINRQSAHSAPLIEPLWATSCRPRGPPLNRCG